MKTLDLFNKNLDLSLLCFDRNPNVTILSVIPIGLEKDASGNLVNLFRVDLEFNEDPVFDKLLGPNRFSIYVKEDGECLLKNYGKLIFRKEYFNENKDSLILTEDTELYEFRSEEHNKKYELVEIIIYKKPEVLISLDYHALVAYKEKATGKIHSSKYTMLGRISYGSHQTPADLVLKKK